MFFLFFFLSISLNRSLAASYFFFRRFGDTYATFYYYRLKNVNGINIDYWFQIMAVTVRSIQKDADDKKTSLNPKPYFRLFINWLLDLTSLDPGTDGANFQVRFIFLEIIAIYCYH